MLLASNRSYMFARRKPRPTDEEPLVPHGLIWQATEQFMSPSNAESLQPEPPDPEIKPVAMPKFWRNHEPPDPNVRRAPMSVPANGIRRPHTARPQDRSGAAPIPAQPIQELNKRRMLIQEERTQREPIAPQIVARTAEPVLSPVTEMSPSSNSVIKAQTFTPAREISVAFERDGASKFHDVALLGRRWIKAVADAVPKFRIRMKVKFAAGSRLRKMSSELWQMFASAGLTLRRNRRLTTAMTMAGLSALLAMGLVISLRDYQPQESTTRSTVAATSKTSSSTAKAPPIVNSVPSKPAPVVVSSSPPPDVKLASERKPVRRAHHVRGDYVAPDTYVVYKKR